MTRLQSVPWWLVAALLAAACGGAAGPTAAGYRELPSNQLLVGVTQEMSSNGVRSALLVSDTVYMFNDSSKAHLRGVFLTLYDEDGVVTSTLRSESGELDTDTERMVARGNVVLIAEGGDRRIESEELHYDPQTRKLWSDVPFVMNTRGEISRGISFESDDQFRNVFVRQPAGRMEGLRFDF
jgi:LPS export ABC transporter protein LptC